MRTEMLIRMEGGSEKGHAAKAMKVAAAMQGVESVTLSGKDKSLLRVVGDGLDCNNLTTRLRRKVGHADVVELRTLHAGAGNYGYGYGSSGARTGSLSRDAAEYGSGGGSHHYGYGGARTGGLSRGAAYGSGGSSHYGYGTGTYPTTAAPDYYYGQQYQPSFQYSYQPPPSYAAPAAVHYEYYPSATDPNGCSIM